jgi:hypothetical protein
MAQRIDGVSDPQARLLTRGVYRAAKGRTGGKVPEPLRIMAHSPSVMWAAGLYEVASARGVAVPKALKTLAGIKIASMIGCVF